MVISSKFSYAVYLYSWMWQFHIIMDSSWQDSFPASEGWSIKNDVCVILTWEYWVAARLSWLIYLESSSFWLDHTSKFTHYIFQIIISLITESEMGMTYIWLCVMMTMLSSDIFVPCILLAYWSHAIKLHTGWLGSLMKLPYLVSHLENLPKLFLAT